MRDYAKIAPTFWTGATGKALKAQGMETVIVAVYLMTCPNSNMLGLYWVPTLYIAHETGLGFEGASKGLAGASEAGFCLYDGASEVVWVKEMAAYQVAESLKPTDNRCAGIQREYDALPDNPFLPLFYERYAVAFNLAEKRGVSKPLRRGSKAPPKPRTGTGAGTGLSDAPEGAADLFDSFWNAYPKKVGKDDARKAFAKRKPDAEMLAAMVKAISSQASSTAWTKDAGQFIPNPATWLNGGRWQDGDTSTQSNAMAGAI